VVHLVEVTRERIVRKSKTLWAEALGVHDAGTLPVLGGTRMILTRPGSTVPFVPVVGERMRITHECRVPWTLKLALRYGLYRRGPGRRRLDRVLGEGRWRGLNLLPPSSKGGEWDAATARENWVAWKIEPPAVLLGSRVAAAAGLPGAGIPSVVNDFLTIPHPSGRSRLWNEEGMEELCKELSAELWPLRASA